MNDDVIETATVTIHIGLDREGNDVTSTDIDGDVTLLTVLGALAIAQRDLLDDVSYQRDDN